MLGSARFGDGKGRMDLLGSARLGYGKGGMDLLGSVWNGYGKVLLVVEEKGVLGPQCSPKHNAFDSSLCGCDLTTSISSPRTSPWTHQRERTNRGLPRQPSKKYSTEADVSHNGRHVLEDSSGDGSRRPGEWRLSPKKSPKKPINRMCLGEESTDESSHSQATVRHQHHRSKADGSFQGSPRWGFKRPPRQGVNVKSTWPGCEVELGTCHCLPYYVHLVHTRIPGWSSPTTERYPLWW